MDTNPPTAAPPPSAPADATAGAAVMTGSAGSDNGKDTAGTPGRSHRGESLRRMRRVLLFVVGPLALHPSHPVFVLYLAYLLTSNVRGIAQ